MCKGPSIKDVSPKGEGGGYPQKETLGDGGGTPFGPKETSFFTFEFREKYYSESIKDVSPKFQFLGYPPSPCLPTSPLPLSP